MTITPRDPPDPGTALGRLRARAGRRWLDAPVRRKFLAVVLLIALAWLPPIAIGLVVGERLSDAREVRQATSAEVTELDAVQDSLIESVTAVQYYTLLGLADPELVDQYREAAASVPGELVALREGLPAPLLPLMDDLEAAVADLDEGVDALLRFGAVGTEPVDVSNDPAVVELNPAMVDTLVASLGTTAAAYDAVDDLKHALAETLVDHRAAVDRLQRFLVWATRASMAAALVVAVGGIYLVTHGVMRRIGALSANVERFADGVRMRRSPRSADELGQLADTMLMAGKLLTARREQAVTATRAKDEFLSRVGRELETPLATMIGDGQVLERDPDISPQSRGDATRIVGAGHHLHDLVQELLDIKAIETGQLTVTKEPVAVGVTADDAIALVRSMPASATIAITAACGPGTTVDADPRRLREVLLNLLSNAVKYNRLGGRVELAAENRGATVHISVTDTGPGISPADQRLLFRPFERLDAAGTDVEGSGVGLALTRHVVEAMGGTIGVDSAPGRGSTFWVDLPAAVVPPENEPVASGPGAAAPGPTPSAPSGPPEPAEPPAPVERAAPAGPAPAVVPRRRLADRWLNAPLGRKLLVLVVMIVLVWLPPIAIGSTVNARLDRARTQAGATADALDDLDVTRDSLQNAVLAMQNFTARGLVEDRFVEQYRTEAAPIAAGLAALREDLPTDLAAPGRRLEESVTTVLGAFDALVQVNDESPMATEGPGAAIRYEVGTAGFARTLAAMTASLGRTEIAFEGVEALEAQIVDRLAAERREVERLHGMVVWATLASMVVALVLSAGGTYLVTNGIVRRIESLSDNAARFARGAPLRPTAGSDDEIGRLADKILVAGKLFAARREQAVAATRAKDEFLSRVSHELKTPLTAMIGFGELLEEDPDLSPDRRAGATRIVAAGHYLLGLIEELLDIKALEAGKLVIDTEAVPLHETVEDAVEAVRSTPAGGTVTITADCVPGLVLAADRRRLREVLVSLLTRAVTVSPDGGRVVLAAEARDAAVHIGVTDSGPGLSPADRASLFTPFERRDDSGPAVPAGGVGLALAKHVVEAMGGTIGVDSPPGQGSTVWLDLPATPADASDGGGAQIMSSVP